MPKLKNKLLTLYKHPCDQRAMNLHRARRAKLLTAEATNAKRAVYDSLFVLDNNSLCRTYLGAFSTANTVARIKLGTRRKQLAK